MGHTPYSPGLYAAASQLSLLVPLTEYELGTVPVRLLSNTLSCSDVEMLASSGGSVPVSTLRDTSMMVGLTRLSTAGSVPFSPRLLSGIENTPPVAYVDEVVQRCHPPFQPPSGHHVLTPVQLRPYTGELLLWAGLEYGAHGWMPTRQLGSSAPLGSSAAATCCSSAHAGWLKPRLVAVKQPVPPVGMLPAVESPTRVGLYENVAVYVLEPAHELPVAV